MQRAMDHDNAVDAVPMEEQLEAIGELLRDGKVKRDERDSRSSIRQPRIHSPSTGLFSERLPSSSRKDKKVL